MASNSSIEWTQATWNPVTGCTRASAGCDNCYAVKHSYRLANCGQEKYAGLTVVNRAGQRHFNGIVRCHEADLNKPLGWREPKVIFVNSMSDLFHRDVPAEFIQRVFDVMNRASHHTFQILTKRPERAAELSPVLQWTSNIWMGTSVEDSRVADRVGWLCQTQAATKFLSIEPLIGPVDDVPIVGVDWVIAGGESGPGARPLDPAWVQHLRDRCVATGVSFFFKQWGHLRNNPDQADPTAKANGGTAKGGRLLDGRTWDEMPAGATQLSA